MINPGDKVSVKCSCGLCNYPSCAVRFVHARKNEFTYRGKDCRGPEDNIQAEIYDSYGKIFVCYTCLRKIYD